MDTDTNKERKKVFFFKKIARSEQRRKIIRKKPAIPSRWWCAVLLELGQVHWPYKIQKKNSGGDIKIIIKRERGRKKNLKKVAKERESARMKRRNNLK